MPQQQYNLSDEFIAQLARLLQLAIITGTNLADNLRLVKVTSNENSCIVLAEEYKKNFEENIEKMLAEAEDIKEEMRSTIVQA